MCVELSWDDDATWTAPPKATPTLGTAEATFFLGSVSDTWSRTWSDTDFTDANFRLRITNVARSSPVRDFSLDWGCRRRLPTRRRKLPLRRQQLVAQTVQRRRQILRQVLARLG